MQAAAVHSLLEEAAHEATFATAGNMPAAWEFGTRVIRPTSQAATAPSVANALGEPNGAVELTTRKPRALRPPSCQVCRHPERERIEALRASGASLDALAKKFHVHRDAIWRHWKDHVSADLKIQYLAGPAEIAALSERAAARRRIDIGSPHDFEIDPDGRDHGVPPRRNGLSRSGA